MNIAELKYTIKKLSAEYLAEFIAIRRHFHQHPELSMEEMETAAYIAHKLDEYHIPYQKGIAQTGIIAPSKAKILPSKPLLSVPIWMPSLSPK